MTLEEIFSNITILKDNTTSNVFLFGICGMGVVLIGAFIFYRWREVPVSTPVMILNIMVGFSLIVLSLWCYILRPRTIKLQIIAEVETVSAEQLAEYFEMSDISMGNGHIICEVEPKTEYYDEVSELLLFCLTER